MRFLYVSAKNSVNDLFMTLRDMGYETDHLEGVQFDLGERDEWAMGMLDSRLAEKGYDFVISYLFFEEVSEVCQRRGVRYISWIYDSPLVSLFGKAASNEVNRIFVFDRAEYERLRDKLPHVYHLPMAACTGRIGRVGLTGEDEKRFSSDISFVGDLYEENAYNRLAGALPEEQMEEIRGYISGNLCDWKKVRPWPLAGEQLVKLCADRGYYKLKNAHGLEASLFLGVALMSRKLAQLERISVLNSLAGLFGDGRVDLYTRSSGEHLQGVRVHPGVDYYTDMTKVFNLSRINLNITIPSIETGLPQRIWDIMGSGGFCLTNHQEEISEYFDIGSEIETFKSIEELLAKAAFYLKHEDLRLKILVKGYEKVMTEHTYEHRIRKMLELSEAG